MNEAVRKLREQQAKVKEDSPQWMVAEQLIGICEAEPESAEIIAEDLDNEQLSIVNAEKALKALADEKYKKNGGRCAAVGPKEAEKALRTFYGLPKRGAEPEPDRGKTLNFLDFMR